MTEIKLIMDASKPKRKTFAELDIGEFYLDAAEQLCQKVVVVGSGETKSVIVASGELCTEDDEIKFVPVASVTLSYNI